MSADDIDLISESKSPISFSVPVIPQADGMRQDLSALKSTIPLQIGALDRRVTAEEQRLEYLDDELMRRAADRSPK